MKQVLIAHQSSIPHYRVPFYNVLERLRPATWQFDVVYDPTRPDAEPCSGEPLDPHRFEFPVLPTRTLLVRMCSKTLRYQTFWASAAHYDLVIVENAVNNLTYPLCHFHQVRGTKIAYWGHGKDRSIENPLLPKAVLEVLKVELVRRADGFFAYTHGVKSYLEQRGVSTQRIFVLNNTIDINEQRRAYAMFSQRGAAAKEVLQVQDQRVLLFVGRFTKSKRVAFLLESFTILCNMMPNVHLFLVGSGGEPYLENGIRREISDKITYFGPIVDLARLAPIYAASDIFAFPGSVGLGPIQAFCYDVPVVTVESPTHGPEIEYLSPENSVVLPAATTAEAYASELCDLLSDTSRLSSLRATTWPSIQHLTVESMASAFIEGVNMILDL